MEPASGVSPFLLSLHERSPNAQPRCSSSDLVDTWILSTSSSADCGGIAFIPPALRLRLYLLFPLHFSLGAPAKLGLLQLTKEQKHHCELCRTCYSAQADLFALDHPSSTSPYWKILTAPRPTSTSSADFQLFLFYIGYQGL